MKKITFFGPSSLKSYGGAEKWVINVSNLLKNKGYDVNVITSSYCPVERINDLKLNEKINFEYHTIPFKKSGITPLKLKYLPPIESDVLYIYGTGFYYLKQLISYDITKIYGFHGNLGDPYKYSWFNLKDIYNLRVWSKIFPHFYKFHILNKNQEEFLKKFLHNPNIYLLENTYLESSFKLFEKFDKFTVFFFGRHEIDKGIETVIYVAENLPEDIDLIIAGKGSKSKMLDKISRKNVKILGFLDDEKLYELLSRSHLLLFPSHLESSSAIPLESLAHQTPIIYRPMPENHNLDKISFNIKAETDIEFLNGIISKYMEYKNDREKYIKNCRELPNYLMSKEEYISKFIEYFIESK